MPVRLIEPTAWHGRDDPEDGSTAIRLHHLVAEAAPRALLGFACEAGVIRNKGRPGAKAAPREIRRTMAGLSAPPDAVSFTDLGDVIVDGDDLEAGQAQLAELLNAHLSCHERIVVLGGGHETAYGTYLGLETQYPDQRIGIINLDAHLDLRNIGAAGPSSGTPFNQIRTRAPDRFDYLCIGVAAESNTQALIQQADEWGVGMVWDRALSENPMAADEPIRALLARNDIVYLTIDIDVLPHYQAPGVSAPCGARCGALNG